MEGNSLNHNLKDHSLGVKIFRDNISSSSSSNKVKGPWDNISSSSYAEDYISGFSWPPRSYICSFCKREFRSAQALGGHMNVHRRDRARLRQSPPRNGQFPIVNLNLNSNPNPTPNPNFSPPSPPSPHSTRLPPYATCTTLPSLVSPSLSSSSSASPNEIKKWGVDGTLLLDPSSPRGSNFTKMKTTKSFFGVKGFNDFVQDDECRVMKKAEIVRLELGIGLISDSKEDVDLELRLGYT
ncbi:hypothetical protein L1049_017322 [Liquidambar formosana]|uniref:C2H2-type domain-containing protein n=1 Tax=Liquidambar formosana TaxID=63359 RepID=A0AAP0S7T6_LIQFO